MDNLALLASGESSLLFCRIFGVFMPAEFSYLVASISDNIDGLLVFVKIFSATALLNSGSPTDINLCSLDCGLLLAGLF